jgi:hypothetical protein
VQLRLAAHAGEELRRDVEAEGLGNAIGPVLYEPERISESRTA